jgi:hypothetical protein
LRGTQLISGFRYRQGGAGARDAGVDHLVFDLRTQFERYMELVEVIGEGVLPRVR